MAIKSFFSKVLGRGNRRGYAAMLDGSMPVFSSFGRDIYVSDIVQTATDKIATEMSKLQPRHTRTDDNEVISHPKSDFNRLLKIRPNPLMSTSELLEKMTWLLYKTYNCFVYPAYDVMMDGRGRMYRKYTGFYPLNPTRIEFLQDEANTLYVKLTFGMGNSFTVPYDEIIHVRKQFSENELMGGDRSGRPNNQSILRVLETEHIAMEGLKKGIPISMGVRGIIKVNTLLDDAKLENERQKFLKAIANNEAGILAIDLKGDYVPINIDPKLIDKDTMAFLQDKVLNWVGVPLNIYKGEYDENDYQAWYEQTLEPLILRFAQVWTYPLFTENELNHGNEIVFYSKNLMYTNTRTKLNILKTMGEQGLLKDNQKLQLMGFPPLEGEDGQRRTQSLNYVSVQIIDDYQMKRAGAIKDWADDVDKVNEETEEDEE